MLQQERIQRRLLLARQPLVLIVVLVVDARHHTEHGDGVQCTNRAQKVALLPRRGRGEGRGGGGPRLPDHIQTAQYQEEHTVRKVQEVGY